MTGLFSRSILIERRTRFSSAIAAVTTNLFEAGKYTDVSPVLRDSCFAFFLLDGLVMGFKEKILSSDEKDQIRPGLACHSRGGKTAFALALDKAATTLNFSVLIGMDPVNGMDTRKQIPSPVLTYVPRSFDHDMAVMIMGSGLGAPKRNPSFPEDFFKECKGLASSLLLRIMGILTWLMVIRESFEYKQHTVCRNVNSTDPMRR
ncbi:hypothetical protein SADUNF_Sadunf08G0127900 [Salix dunnii]|uniref:Chlorophyllase n=1 Tax=Salix dunnii TaxID=1413687 RepID=A0A835N1L0_9ROSI|nr:hypothetical protein SADUNF_Sadunf08G0127900 [Salix dunnii]